MKTNEAFLFCSDVSFAYRSGKIKKPKSAAKGFDYTEVTHPSGSPKAIQPPEISPGIFCS
ncbi:MAG: hypothetical protein JSU01_08615 [Bacteroidetes bacterium]|nr:hypothetical protein [Bacteroidota bacterium]